MFKGHSFTACAVALATVLFAAPAAAQTCATGEGIMICGVVWDDANGNGEQDLGEAGIAGVKVTLSDANGVVDVAYTDSNGNYVFDAASGSEYTLSISTTDPAFEGEAQPSPADAVDDAVDSDGVDLGSTSSVTFFIVDGTDKKDIDFGFVLNGSPSSGGTGTPGYWKNHPEAWPDAITVGSTVYTRDEAIAWLNRVGRNKAVTMFSSLVPAILNRMAGNPSECVDDTIAAAEVWMDAHPVDGNVVHASSQAWAEGQPLHTILDDYNNGLLCAPPRN